MIRRETTSGHGQADRDRYVEKIRDRIRKALPGIPGDSPVISGPGDQPVTVPIPGGGMGLPHFVPRRPAEPADGAGQGPGQPGDIVQIRPTDGGDSGQAPGSHPGDHDIEVTMSLDEWRQWILADLALPDLRPKPNDQITETETVWTSRSRTGSLSTLDKKATLKEAVARSQSQQQPLTFMPDDLRYHSWVDRPQPKTAAVVYFCRDISASMGGERQYLARATAWYLAAVLQRAYPICPVRFWVHDTQGWAVSEDEFLTLTARGGTQAGPVYTAMQAEMDADYPLAAWNRYVFHFTDGDMGDVAASATVAGSWVPTLARFGVALLAVGVSITRDQWLQAMRTAAPPMRVSRLTQRADVVGAVQTLLAEGEHADDR